jgi:hypothetical protein
MTVLSIADLLLFGVRQMPVNPIMIFATRRWVPPQ